MKLSNTVQDHLDELTDYLQRKCDQFAEKLKSIPMDAPNGLYGSVTGCITHYTSNLRWIERIRNHEFDEFEASIIGMLVKRGYRFNPSVHAIELYKKHPIKNIRVEIYNNLKKEISIKFDPGAGMQFTKTRGSWQYWVRPNWVKVSKNYEEELEKREALVQTQEIYNEHIEKQKKKLESL